MINGSLINGALINGAGTSVTVASLDATGRRGALAGYAYRSQLYGAKVTGRRGGLAAHAGSNAVVRGRRGAFTGTADGDTIGRLSVTGRRGAFTATASGDWLAHCEATGRRGTFSANTGSTLAVSGKRGTLAATIPGEWVARCTATGRRGTLSASMVGGTVARLDVTGRRGYLLYGNLAATGRRGTLVATALSAAQAQAIAYAMNLAGGGLMPYSNYDFDFIVRCQGKSYGLNSTGAYLLEGDDDAGTAIAAFAELPPADFGLSNEKRMDSVYVGSRAPGPFVVTAEADEGTPYSYTTVAAGRNKRAKIGKGLRGVYWGFKVANTNGAKLDIDRIEILPAMSRQKTRA